jgi:hypothetical protein
MLDPVPKYVPPSLMTPLTSLPVVPLNLATLSPGAAAAYVRSCACYANPSSVALDAMLPSNLRTCTNDGLVICCTLWNDCRAGAVRRQRDNMSRTGGARKRRGLTTALSAADMQTSPNYCSIYGWYVDDDAMEVIGKPLWP